MKNKDALLVLLYVCVLGLILLFIVLYLAKLKNDRDKGYFTNIASTSLIKSAA